MPVLSPPPNESSAYFASSHKPKRPFILPMAEMGAPAALGDAQFAVPPETSINIVSHRIELDADNQPLYTEYNIETKVRSIDFTAHRY
jgi:hypothetical protein